MFVSRVGFLRGLILGRGVTQCIRSFTWLPTSGTFLACYCSLLTQKLIKLIENKNDPLVLVFFAFLAWF